MRVVALAAVFFVLTVSASWGSAGAVSHSTTLNVPSSYVKTHWRATVARPPANAAVTGNAYVHVSSISCPSPGNCAAVGGYRRRDGGSGGVLLTEKAGRWRTGVEAVLPANASTRSVALHSVSCASAGNCTAVGIYSNTSHGVSGILLTETNGRWAAGVKALLPAGDPHSEKGRVWLSSVSCASAGNCTAVGTYWRYPYGFGLLFTEKAGHWARGVKPPLPANAGPNQLDLEIPSVSCSSDGTCAAVGTYNFVYGRQDAAGEGMLLSNAGGRWRAVKAAMPPDGPGEGVILTSVSCARGGNCGATGIYHVDIDFNAPPEGVLLTEKAGVWRRGVRARPPANASFGRGPNFVDLGGGISCPSPGSCGAVGDYYPPHANGIALFTQGGGTWRTGVESVLPHLAHSPDGAAISCASPGNCTVVGGYGGDPWDTTNGLLLTELGGRWAPGVTAPDSIQSVSAVSCASPGNCGAAGADAEGEAILLDSTTGPSLGWSRSRGGPAILSDHFGTIHAGGSVSRWFRLWNPRSTPSGKLAVTLTGSPAFSITSDPCAGRSIGTDQSCWVHVTYAPRTAGSNDNARLRAIGAYGPQATIGLSGCTASASSGRVYWVDDGDGTLNEVSVGGGCVTTIATGLDNPVALAADSKNVYWLDSLDRTLNEVPIGGGAVTTLATKQKFPAALAVDGTHVYWVSGAYKGTVHEVSVDGGTVKTLARDQPYPSSVAVEGKYVYWTDSGLGDFLPGTVNKVPVGGGAVTTLATDGGSPSSLAVNGTHVYWTSLGGCCESEGTVKEVPIGGGSATTLASGQNEPYAIAADAAHVYWATREVFDGASAALKVLPSGGTVKTLTSLDGYGSFGLAAYGGNVFWTFSVGETVRSVPAGGGVSTILASGHDRPGPIAVVP